MSIIQAVELGRADYQELPMLSVMDTAGHFAAVAALDAYSVQASDFEPDFIGQTRKVARAMLRQWLDKINPNYRYSPAHLTDEATEFNGLVKDQVDEQTCYTLPLIEAGLDPGAPELSDNQRLLLSVALTCYQPPKPEPWENDEPPERRGTALGIKLGLFDGDKMCPDRETELGKKWVKQGYENR